MQLTVHVPDQHVQFFKELVEHLSFPVTVTEENHSQAELKADIRQAMQELTLVKQGKLAGRPVSDLLNEL